MKTLGLLGGMSYHSTVDYYMGINDAVAHALGGHTSAPLLIDSVNFDDIRSFQVHNDWPGAGDYLAAHAVTLEKAGAEGIVICTNLMHKVAPLVEAAIKVPLIHIVDAVADEAHRRGLSALGIMGARWTMADDFYATRLAVRGITAIKAAPGDVDTTDRIIFDELTLGDIRDESRAELLGVSQRLTGDGADGVLLACTELPLILHDNDAGISFIDSTQAHVKACVRFVLDIPC